MGNIERTILLPEEWGLVAPIVAAEFGNAMLATPAQATFPAFMDGDRLAGFVHVETLFHFNCVYLAPEYRRPGLALELMRYAIERIPAGFSGVWLTDRRVGAIAKNFGARSIGEWTVYRKDI